MNCHLENTQKIFCLRKSAVFFIRTTDNRLWFLKVTFVLLWFFCKKKNKRIDSYWNSFFVFRLNRAFPVPFVFTLGISGLPKLVSFSSIVEEYRGYLPSEIDRFELCICAGAIPFPYPSTYFRLLSTFLSQGFLANRSTGSSALLLVSTTSRTSLESWDGIPGKLPLDRLSPSQASDVVRL